MVKYINDYCDCDCCGEEAPQGYRVVATTLCGDCLEELYAVLDDKLG